jgi:hypothetical protein
MERRIAGAVVTAAVCLGGLFAPASTAAASTAAAAAPTCRTVIVSRPGAEAQITECQEDTSTSVRGWVRDTADDGKCAVLRISWPGDSQTVRACGLGQRTGFGLVLPGQPMLRYELRTA